MKDLNSKAVKRKSALQMLKKGLEIGATTSLSLFFIALFMFAHGYTLLAVFVFCIIFIHFAILLTSFYFIGFKKTNLHKKTLEEMIEKEKGVISFYNTFYEKKIRQWRKQTRKAKTEIEYNIACNDLEEAKKEMTEETSKSKRNIKRMEKLLEKFHEEN